jgi:hypothetical protein
MIKLLNKDEAHHFLNDFNNYVNLMDIMEV